MLAKLAIVLEFSERRRSTHPYQQAGDNEDIYSQAHFFVLV